MGAILNHDIVGIHNRLVRMMKELHHSQSSNSSGVNQFDADRIRQYLTDIRSRIDWTQKEPAVDLPETHPTMFELRPAAELAEVENEDINDMIRLCKLGCIELELSASSRDPARMNKFDHSRCEGILNKMESLLENHIVKVTPIDRPESSPRAAGITAGRRTNS
ncbi:MAG: hypothetical protein ACXABY_06980 [Candidatus Thorarchaeota archaeon]|jgi:hypothetical protein